MAAFSVGHVVFVVLLQDFKLDPERLALDDRPLGRFEFPERYLGYMVPIWPYSDPLAKWPPRFALTNEDLTGFASWQDVVFSRPDPPRVVGQRWSD